MFWPWTFGHLLVINPNRKSVLVPPSVYPLILHFLPVPPSNRWWPCSRSCPPAALIVLLAGFHSCPGGVWWPWHSASLSLCFPPTPPPLLSPLPFHTPPANGLPCPSPAIPLSISDSEAARGEEERREARKRRGGSSPLFPWALASVPLQWLDNCLNKPRDPVVHTASEENRGQVTLIMAGRAVCQVALALSLMLSLPAGAWFGCPAACRCSFAMLQCLEADGISSIPGLAHQESENVTEMWVRFGRYVIGMFVAHGLTCFLRSIAWWKYKAVSDQGTCFYITTTAPMFCVKFLQICSSVRGPLRSVHHSIAWSQIRDFMNSCMQSGKFVTQSSYWSETEKLQNQSERYD